MPHLCFFEAFFLEYHLHQHPGEGGADAGEDAEDEIQLDLDLGIGHVDGVEARFMAADGLDEFFRSHALRLPGVGKKDPARCILIKDHAPLPRLVQPEDGRFIAALEDGDSS